jgi:uncharacterized protein (UPF0332 family)
MDPFQFLLLAEWLLKEQAHPAGCRSAVSRAYYAAHHCLKDFVEAAGVSYNEFTAEGAESAEKNN